MENQEKQLAQLFKEIHSKPTELDESIMQNIRQIAPKTQVSEKKKESFVWMYAILGIGVLAGLILAFPYLNLKSNSTAWTMVLAISFPLLIDFIWKQVQLNKNQLSSN